MTGRMRRIEPGTWVATAIVIVHAVWTTRLQWDIHRGLGTSSYDVGLYDQGAWLLSRFQAPFVTLMGRNLLGDHASLVMFFVVPFYWIIPGTETLLALQSLVVAAGALPVYFFARRALRSQVSGLVFAAAWLVNPAVNGANLENFHPDSFLGLFLPFALWAMFSRRWRLFALGVVLCMTVKEDVSLVLVPLGALVALRGDVRKGVLTAVAAVAASLAGMFLLMRSLIGVPTRNGWRIPFGGVGGFVRTTFSDPGKVWQYLTSEGRAFYLWQMLSPFGFVFLLAPEVAFVSAFVVAANIVSTFWYQFHIGYHYSLVAVPALVFASIVGTARLHRDSRPVAVAVVLTCSLLSAWSWTALPGARNEMAHWSSDHPVAVSAADIVDRVPDDARISVFHSLAPHLAHRKYVFQFPNPFYVVLYGTDVALEGTRDPLADTIDLVVLPRTPDPDLAAKWAEAGKGFTVREQNDHWTIWGRDG